MLRIGGTVVRTVLVVFCNTYFSYYFRCNGIFIDHMKLNMILAIEKSLYYFY